MAIRALLTFLVAFHSYSSVQPIKKNNFSQVKNISLKKSELILGREILGLKKQIRKNSVQTRLAKRVNSKLKNATLLSYLKPWSQEVLKISSLNASKAHFNFCEKLC